MTHAGYILLHMMCSVDGCADDVLARGICHKHYERFRRNGTLPPKRKRPSMKERIESGITKIPNGCWIWNGAKDACGYGMITDYPNGTKRVHRAYLETLGVSLEGRFVDHLCRVTSCCKPEHLEVVSHRENVLRGVGPTAANARKTHCIHGHEFTPENTIWRSNAPGTRDCRMCARERSRRHREANR